MVGKARRNRHSLRGLVLFIIALDRIQGWDPSGLGPRGLPDVPGGPHPTDNWGDWWGRNPLEGSAGPSLTDAPLRAGSGPPQLSSVY